jgi:hypothetical protein
MKILFALIGIVIVVGVLGSLLPNADDQPARARSPGPKEAHKIDLTIPVYTGKATVICPLDILFDRKEGSGLQGATKAAATIFGRSEAVTKVGCQEWKAGQRLYVSDPADGQMWQKVTPYSGSPAELLAFTLDLTNSEN